METTMIVKTDDVDAKAMTAVEQAKAMTISTVLEFAKADGFCVALKNLEKEIIDTFADAKAKAFAAHRAVTAAEAKHLIPVQEARKITKTKMVAFQDAEDARQRAEEKRLEDEARKKAEEAALAAAEAAEKSGDKAQAEAIISAPVEVAPVVLPKSTPKAATVLRKIWTYRVVNENLVPRAYLMLDTTKLGQQARATQDTIKVPGIEFFQKPI
jgi:hypothetical protein